jgi:hypothetical protein
VKQSSHTLTIKKGPFALQVAPGADGGVAVTGSGKADFRVIGRDIRYIKTGTPDFFKSGDGFTGSWFFWLMLGLPVAAFFGIAFYYRKNRKELADATLFRSRKAGAKAVKRLSAAKKSLDSGDTAGFYTETYKALWDYSAHKLGIPVASLTRDQVAGKLAAIGTDPELIRSMENLIDRCEMSRFAAGAMSGAPSDVYHNAVELITKIENGTAK